MYGVTTAVNSGTGLESAQCNHEHCFLLQIELAQQGRYIYLQEVGPRWLLDSVSRLSQPKYFMNNIGDVESGNNPDPRELLADNIFPAYFFGPAGSQSPLHTDGALATIFFF